MRLDIDEVDGDLCVRLHLSLDDALRMREAADVAVEQLRAADEREREWDEALAGLKAWVDKHGERDSEQPLLL